MQRPANSSGRKASSRRWQAGRARRSSLPSQASVAGFHAAIAEHTKARDLLTAKRTELDAGTQSPRREEDRICPAPPAAADPPAGAGRRDSTGRRNSKARSPSSRTRKPSTTASRRPQARTRSVRQRLDQLREKKAEHLRLTGRTRVCRKRDRRPRRPGREAEGTDHGARRGRARSRPGSSQRSGPASAHRQGIAEDRLEAAVNFRLAEINKRTGTLAAQLQHYKEEREKILADQKTIRKAGADGICPLCRAETGRPFREHRCGVHAKLQELADKAVADLERQEKLGKEKTGIEALKPVARRNPHHRRETPAEAGVSKPSLPELVAEARAEGCRSSTALTGSLAKLGYDDAAYLSCEREAAEVQKVQLRFIELGKKIGAGRRLAKSQLAELTRTDRGAERRTRKTRRGDQNRLRSIRPRSRSCEAAVAETDAALRNEEVGIANATKDLRLYGREDRGVQKSRTSRSPSCRSRPANSGTRSSS